MKALIAILALVTLAGCSVAQTAQQQAEKRVADAALYADENIFNRRTIRNENWDSLMAQARKLDDEGKHEDARKLRCSVYPPLVTLGTLRETEENRFSDSLRKLDMEVAGCKPKPAGEVSPLAGAEPVGSQPLE